MTAPRQVLRGTTYLVTRRCTQRQFLLTPSPLTNAIFSYVLAVAAARFGVEIHAFCVMSNHFHLLVTDPDARLPAFQQYLGALVARAVNAALGRWESFWAPASYSAVALATPEDIVAKAAYLLANPVAAGLVARGRDWPGLWSAPELLGSGRIPIARPDSFFRTKGPMPGTAELRLTVPPGFASADEFRDCVCPALERLEREATRTEDGREREFVGREQVVAQDPSSTPSRPEARRTLDPRIGARDRWKRIEAISRLKEFLSAYRAAWAALREGVRDALFPPGTYQLRVLHGVRCAEAV